MKFFYPAVIAVFIAGCSANSTVETKTNINAATANNGSTAINSMPAANETANANPIVKNGSNAPSGNVEIKSGDAGSQNGFEVSKQTKASAANVAPIRAAPIKNSAPDNSEISSTMNAEGIPVEIRTFKNNPRLLKTEKILADPKNPTINVYLKNGKVVTFPASRINDSVNASANEILTAAGVIP